MKDNFDFYDEEERRLAKQERDLPICDICGEPMYEWYEFSYKLQDFKICENCIEKKEI